MMKRLLAILIAVSMPCAVFAQRYFSFAGKVVSEGAPVAGAVVYVAGAELWCMSEADGSFYIKNVQQGDYDVKVSALGYVSAVEHIDIERNIDDWVVSLAEDNLAIDEVVVTAKENDNAMATSRTIEGSAIDHLQMMNASDVSQLLPGGKTINPDLTQDNVFSLRDGGQSSLGNASFGTAVEVDGVRLSTNASLGGMSGASTRNISSTNVESVEVITGVPSAEYGDMSSGMVKIHTRKGRTPFNVQLSTNPHTKQVAVSKGFGFGKHGGALNASAEYTRATKNPVSPYESYSRAGLSLDYSNTFAHVLRFEAGVTGNLGGMYTKDDPDAFAGEWTRDRDNAVRGHLSLEWLINKPWITDLSLDASVNYEDNIFKQHKVITSNSRQPAPHSAEEGYYIVDMLPLAYEPTQVMDSKELDYAATLKATWARRFGDIISNAKIGVAWRADGNVGRGEYYTDPSLAPFEYRPRPYYDIPYMHNLAFFVEENITLPIASTRLQIMAGLRGESTFIKGSLYDKKFSLSPRFNVKYRITDEISIRGGWGITEKLPSFAVLYPDPMYRDYRVFDASYADGNSMYVYYTQPWQIEYNPDLKWQRNRNAEAGIDLSFGGFGISLVGYFNKTRNPYELETDYDPFSYTTYKLPAGYRMPANPQFKVDSQTGDVFVRDADAPTGDMYAWQRMDVGQTRRTFVGRRFQANGSAIDRKGVELTLTFPQINPIRTQFRVDGAYGYTRYSDEELYPYYDASQANPYEANALYPFVGMYANCGSSNTTWNGRITHSLDMNLTAITHIPSIRMVVTVRLEAALLHRQRNTSTYNGREYAFNIERGGSESVGGSIYDGGNYTAVYPVCYRDLNGDVHPFTEAEASNPEFAGLIIRSNNPYQYDMDGYGAYFSANLSITKEIGDHVSISFYANNFTNSRRAVKSYATGVKAIYTPKFYYGLTLRLKF